MDSWDNTQRNVLVVDEVNFLDYNRSEQAAFERYVNYGVSHKSLMMILIVQDMRAIFKKGAGSPYSKRFFKEPFGPQAGAYIINGDSPMTPVANTVAMTTLAVHTLQPHIF